MRGPAARAIGRDWHGIRQEPAWRRRPAPGPRSDPSRILVCRWRDDDQSVREHAAAGDPDCAIVAIALRPTDLALFVDGRRLHDGKYPAGTALVTPAGRPVRAEFRGPCDLLHLFVPTSRLEGIAERAGRESPQDFFNRISLTAPDPTIERLAWLLLKATDFEAGSADLYLEGLALAILARLIEAGAADAGTGARGRGLLKWRLKRVQDYVETDLTRPLSLADLAECAGLSRMHFAAQFRVATGLQPHEYVVHRRILRAQEILRNTAMPLVEVALAVGFQTQAHFTTVFRRLLGETPGRWRQRQRLDMAPQLN